LAACSTFNTGTAARTVERCRHSNGARRSASEALWMNGRLVNLFRSDKRAAGVHLATSTLSGYEVAAGEQAARRWKSDINKARVQYDFEVNKCTGTYSARSSRFFTAVFSR
jgi:hypothetical protein